MPNFLVSPANGGSTNWPPPAYSPLTGRVYVPEHDTSFGLLFDGNRSARRKWGLAARRRTLSEARAISIRRD